MNRCRNTECKANLDGWRCFIAIMIHDYTKGCEIRKEAAKKRKNEWTLKYLKRNRKRWNAYQNDYAKKNRLNKKTS